MSFFSKKGYRKFDSAIQKKRSPIKDPQKFNELLQEFTHQLGIYMMDLRESKINKKAVKKALEIAENLTMMEPERAVPWTNKCLALGALGRISEALDANKRALEIDPSDPDKWELRANILKTLGRHDEARQALARARELKQ